MASRKVKRQAEELAEQAGSSRGSATSTAGLKPSTASRTASEIFGTLQKDPAVLATEQAAESEFEAAIKRGQLRSIPPDGPF